MRREPVNSFFRAAIPAALGVLLIVSSFAKASAPDPATRVLETALGAGVPGWAVLVVCMAELCMGVALVVPATRRGAMVGATVFFVGAIGVLLLARARGHAGGCGCFGRYSPSINATIVLDGAIVTACGLWFLVFSERSDRHAEDPHEDHR